MKLEKLLQIANINPKLLKESFQSSFSIPDDWNIFTHHLTVIFGKDAKIWANNNQDSLGSIIPMNITEICYDDKAIAAVVKVSDKIPQDLKSYLNSKIPHITIATAPGVKPVYSNEMLNSNDKKCIKFSMQVTGVLKFESGYLGIILDKDSVDRILSS
jgi:tRNA splicing ligase